MVILVHRFCGWDGHGRLASAVDERPSCIIVSMQATDVLGAAVTVFGVGMGASTLLQVRRIVKRGRSDDVSIGMMVILICGSILWLAYGFVHSLVAVIATNGTWLIGATLALSVAIRYRRSPRVGTESETVRADDSVARPAAKSR